MPFDMDEFQAWYRNEGPGCDADPEETEEEEEEDVTP